MAILTDEIRYQLLKQLEQSPNLSQRELAEILGISLGKTNYCLKALLDRGWIKVDNFRRSQNKLGYAYLLTAKGMEEKGKVTLRFLKYKQQEYDELLTQLEQLRAEAAKFTAAKE